MGGVLTRDPLPKVSMKRGTNVVDNWPFTICAAACVSLSSRTLTAAVSQIDLDAWFRAYKLHDEKL